MVGLGVGIADGARVGGGVVGVGVGDDVGMGVGAGVGWPVNPGGNGTRVGGHVHAVGDADGAGLAIKFEMPTLFAVSQSTVYSDVASEVCQPVAVIVLPTAVCSTDSNVTNFVSAIYSHSSTAKEPFLITVTRWPDCLVKSKGCLHEHGSFFQGMLF